MLLISPQMLFSFARYLSSFLNFLVMYSLAAREGFIQPIFYKRFDHFSLQIKQKALKKTVASCDVTGGITLGTKLKMSIFTLYLPHNLQSRFLGFENLM